LPGEPGSKSDQLLRVFFFADYIIHDFFEFPGVFGMQEP
jgi:hypothetical protein